MKTIIYISSLILAFFVIFLFPVRVRADDEYIASFRDSLSEIGEELPDTLSDGIGIRPLLSDLLAPSPDGEDALRLFTVLLALTLLSSLFVSFCGEGRSDLCRGLNAALAAVGAGGLISSLSAFIASLNLSLSRAGAVFRTAFPALASVALASGASATASTESATVSLMLSFLSFVSDTLMPRAIPWLFLLVLPQTFDPDGSAAALSSSIRRLFTRVFGILSVVFLAVLGLQGLVAGAQDSVTLRAAKAAAADLIPVVGGSVSGALSALTAGLGYAATVIGGGSVALLLSILLAPFLRLLLYRFALSFAGRIGAFFGDRRNVGIGLGEALLSVTDTVIAYYGFSAMLYLFGTVILLKSGVKLL